jgi:hypothetical protein
VTLVRRFLFPSVGALLLMGCATTVTQSEDASRGRGSDEDEEDTRSLPDTSNESDTAGEPPDGAVAPDGLGPDDDGTSEGPADGGPADSGSAGPTDAAPPTDTGGQPDSGGDPDLCGNGALDPGEACDDGTSNSNDRPGACRTDCQRARCGDGVTDPGEGCDDADDVDSNACSNSCVPVALSLCLPCPNDGACGRSVDRCVNLEDGQFCGVACTNDAGCPSDYRCAAVAGIVEMQCIPRSGVCAPCVDPDGDGYGRGTECLGLDCDESNPAVHPGASEVCDEIDNNCDGNIDEGLDKERYWLDVDGDGYGAGGTTLDACSLPPGYAGNDDDCDDTRDDVAPGQTEICDRVDNNCVGGVDEGLPTVAYYPDLDNDGVGALGSTAVQSCGPFPGLAPSNLDCNDSANSVYPGAPELCDSRDNDCDGEVDEDIATQLWPDADNDGFGSSTAAPISACSRAGYVANNTDCDDTTNARRPGATEICDGIDNNCDSQVDNGASCGCTVRQYSGHGYLFCGAARTWTESRDYCTARGYDLVTIDNLAENTWVRTEYGTAIPSLCTNTCRYDFDFDCDDGGPFSDYSYCEYGTDCGDCGTRRATTEFWIGINDRNVEGTFVWQSGRPVTYTNWASGEPNNSGGEDCTEYYTSNGLWNDEGCTDQDIAFVCESR